MTYYHCTKCGKKYKRNSEQTINVKEWTKRGIKEKTVPSCCNVPLRVIDKKTYEAIK